jgi:2-dehydro-3-deoxygluconokinase
MSIPLQEFPRQPTIVTCGEALVAALPMTPVTIESGEPLRMFVGGAEVNFAIGASRLGLDVTWIGCLGDDPLGRFVMAYLESEGIDTRHVQMNEGFTGLYLREWLADGERRPYYYRKDSAGSRFAASNWPSNLGGVDWLHVTGITPALSASCRTAISFDPNYRRQLWNEAEARATLLPILRCCRILLLGTDEAELLLGTDVPEEIARRARALGIETVVVKLGDQGACAFQGDSMWREGPFDVVAIDPVGAGDAFDAGFVSALVAGRSVGEALRLGAYCGAKVAEQLGENAGFPRRAAIPPSVISLDQ